MRCRVTYSHKKPPYWEVTAADDRWWSVAYIPPTINGVGRHVITNQAGRTLNADGPTGQHVLSAVFDFERNTEPARVTYAERNKP